MSNLFKKALVITDIHFGLKSNSILHNEDCLAFIRWATKLAKEQGCESCIFMGDYHNNRATVNVQTLSYCMQGLEHLSENFDQVFFIPGNHDLFFRDKRDIHSSAWAKHLSNVIICNDWFKSGDVTIVPWLVGDDFKQIPKVDTKYTFGHFELPHFYMNAMVRMPEHVGIQREDFVNTQHVFSGHFHKRQSHQNITYIGNCFPHNYADAGDDERGCMILEWGQQPEFHSWPDQPVYRVYNLSDVLNHTDKLLLAGMHARVNLDIDISYEEASFIKDTFMETYKLREIKLIAHQNNSLDGNISLGNITFQSVDQIVSENLTSIASEHYDPKVLLDIYRNL